MSDESRAVAGRSDDRVVDLVLDRMNKFEGKFEAKMNEMASAITTLARVEERMASGTDKMSQLTTDLDSLSSRVRELEKLRWKIAGAMVLASALGGGIGALGALLSVSSLGGAA
ncbi:hypothetical protein [Thioalkalivibrio sp. ALJ8]|uniref:hypothetical protein n=1 Tax=Thioalkalivibrio sp. ALJ8 TaxID=1158757 RepID=UPI00037AE78C|nr:hypothetical protein [Thioalkalivibrio sp. ALJ8]